MSIGEKIRERRVEVGLTQTALAAQDVQAQYPYFVYEPSVSASMDYIKQHGAELVTNMAQEQRDALNAVIQRCSGYTATTPDEAARTMRACIGLTKPQALANVNYREAVKNAYLKAHPKANPATAEKKAGEAAARYAGKQHRYRAQNIARTELAYAYNAGAYGATKDAQAQGYIGDCVKVWLTAYDERVCPICSVLDGEKRNMDAPFSNGKTLPPAHPQCRCAVAYEEIPGTNLTGGDGNAGKPTLTNAVGHVIIPVDHTTLTAETNSITQETTAKGGINRNYYGADGRQIKQISNHNHGNPGRHTFGEHGEHAHDYVLDKQGIPRHMAARELTDEEREENADIL